MNYYVKNNQVFGYRTINLSCVIMYMINFLVPYMMKKLKRGKREDRENGRGRRGNCQYGKTSRGGCYDYGYSFIYDVHVQRSMVGSIILYI